MFSQRWTTEQELSLLMIFDTTEGTMWDKAEETNKRWNGSGWFPKNLITLVNKYYQLKKNQN
jgi:hypothetical protein